MLAVYKAFTASYERRRNYIQSSITVIFISSENFDLPSSLSFKHIYMRLFELFTFYHVSIITNLIFNNKRYM